MDNLTAGQVVNGILGLLILAAGPCAAIWYWKSFRLTTGDGSHVDSTRMDGPELGLGLLLTTVFLLLIAVAASAGPPEEVQESGIIEGSLFYMVIVAVIASFLYFRRYPLLDLLGFHKITPGETLRRSVKFILIASPLVLLCSLAVRLIPGMPENPQEIVNFFQKAASRGNYNQILLTALMASVIAPFAEEFIFRGFLYGVTKRYIGITGGMIFTSALFAAIHLNVPSFVALFILAMCLNIAYERTGSIAVPMVMHAIFNFTQLSLMYLAVKSGAV